MSWTERIVNREVKWECVEGALRYEVVGERTNYGEGIVREECRKVVLMRGKRHSYLPGDDQPLMDVAALWQAKVTLHDGRVYDVNSDYEHVRPGSEYDDYPYFKHD